MTSASKFHERTCEYSSEIFIDVINNRLGPGNVPFPHLPSGFCAAGLGTCVEVYTPSWCSQSTALYPEQSVGGDSLMLAAWGVCKD